MNSLPQELVDRISSYLHYEDLKNTLFLSRNFQYAAEKYSGAFLKYDLTEENADKFLETYSGRRFRYLSRLDFHTSFSALESTEDADESCRYTTEELEYMDNEFTRQINLVFSTLKTLESGLGRVHSPTICLKIYTPARRVERQNFCLHHTFVSWRVHLISPSTLPSLASVQALHIQRPDETYYAEGPQPSVLKLDLRAILDIASKLPNLEFLICRVGGDEWYHSIGNDGLRHIARDWAGPRRDSRNDFGKTLQETTLPCLRKAVLDFLYPLFLVEDIDQRIALPNFVKPSTYDIFNTSLRLLSYQLRKMTLRVVADETLFWPGDDSTPSWPNLQTINIMFHMSTPSGTWYFRGAPAVGATEGFDIAADMYPPVADTDEGYNDCTQAGDLQWGLEQTAFQFRVVPNEEIIVPFLTTFAKAAASMPSLHETALWSPLKYDDSLVDNPNQMIRESNAELAWGIAYTKPDVLAFSKQPGEDYCSSRQMWWKVGKWRPDAALHQQFQEIGCDQHGEGLLEYWPSPSDYAGEGLDYRGCFEYFGLSDD